MFRANAVLTRIAAPTSAHLVFWSILARPTPLTISTANVCHGTGGTACALVGSSTHTSVEARGTVIAGNPFFFGVSTNFTLPTLAVVVRVRWEVIVVVGVRLWFIIILVVFVIKKLLVIKLLVIKLQKTTAFRLIPVLARSAVHASG